MESRQIFHPFCGEREMGNVLSGGEAPLELSLPHKQNYLRLKNETFIEGNFFQSRPDKSYYSGVGNLDRYRHELRMHFDSTCALILPGERTTKTSG